MAVMKYTLNKDIHVKSIGSFDSGREVELIKQYRNVSKIKLDNKIFFTDNSNIKQTKAGVKYNG